MVFLLYSYRLTLASVCNVWDPFPPLYICRSKTEMVLRRKDCCPVEQTAMFGYSLHPVATRVSEELNLRFYVHRMNSSLGGHAWRMPLILNSTNNSTIPDGKDGHE